MSLLDSGNQDVLIFSEIETTDSYGNPIIVPAEIGTPVRARVQPLKSSEDASLGSDIETTYRLRVDRNDSVPFGAWAAVEWRGKRYEVLGEPEVHTGSAITRHTTATIRRS